MNEPLPQVGRLATARFVRQRGVTAPMFRRYNEACDPVQPDAPSGDALPSCSTARAGDMLEHLRIVELGQVIAGTFGGMILSDLGADVIKVEPPHGDAGRRSAIYGIGDESAIHLTHNRNKRSVVLDLKTEGGREVLFDLIRSADAVVENFRPGVIDRLGVGFDRMRAVNPSVVLVSVSGFGQDAPSRDQPAYDLILQAMRKSVV